MAVTYLTDILDKLIRMPLVKAGSRTIGNYLGKVKACDDYEIGKIKRKKIYDSKKNLKWQHYKEK